jgi:hypothetical protein
MQVPDTQLPLQQSELVAQTPLVGWQAHCPPAHDPLQHSAALEHACPPPLQQVPGNGPAPAQLTPPQQSAPFSQGPPAGEHAHAPPLHAPPRQSRSELQHTPVGATHWLCRQVRPLQHCDGLSQPCMGHSETAAQEVEASGLPASAAAPAVAPPQPARGARNTTAMSLVTVRMACTTRARQRQRADTLLAPWS